MFLSLINTVNIWPEFLPLVQDIEIFMAEFLVLESISEQLLVLVKYW